MSKKGNLPDSKSEAPSAHSKSKAGQSVGRGLEHARAGNPSSHVRSKRNSPYKARLLVGGGIFAGVIILLSGGLLAYRFYVDTTAHNLERACKIASTAGNWQQLKVQAVQWSVLEPQRFEPWYYAATASKNMRDLPGAVEYLSKLPDAAPLEAWLDLSSLQLEALDRATDALLTCQRTARLYPRSAEVHGRLMYFYVMLRERDKIIEEARRAIAQGADIPETYVYLVSADWLTFTNGYESNQNWLKLEPKNEQFEAASIVHLVGSAKANDDYRMPPDAKALPRIEYLEARLRAALQKYPKNVELLNLQLDRDCEQGKLSEVATLLPGAPPETFRDNRFWRFKGWYHAALEEWDAARAAYEKAIELSPLDWKSLTELLTVYRRTNQFDKVEQLQSRATEGEEIKREVERVARADMAQDKLLQRIANYLSTCGEQPAAEALEKLLHKGGARSLP